MSFYGYFFASAYYLFLKRKGDTPIFASCCFLTLFQMLHAFLFFAFLQKFFNINFHSLAKFKYLIVPVYIFWLIIAYRFYNQQRVEKIKDVFINNDRQKQSLWIAISIISFVGQIVIIAFLLKK